MSNAATAREDLATLPEAELVARARRREGDAFREIMQRHNRRVYRMARGVLRDESEAEDVVQETFMRAFAGLDGFRGEASLATWLTRIVLNEAYARLRGRRPSAELSVLDHEPPSAEILMFRGGLEDPEKAVAQAQVRVMLEREIDALPEHFRLVLLMRDVEGVSVEDTAKLLDLLPQTVKTRLFRARRLLREALHTRLSTMLSGAFPFAGARCARISAAVMARIEAAPAGPVTD